MWNIILTHSPLPHDPYTPQKATFLLLEEPGILITIDSIIDYWFGSSFAALKNNVHNSSNTLLSFSEQKLADKVSVCKNCTLFQWLKMLKVLINTLDTGLIFFFFCSQCTSKARRATDPITSLSISLWEWVLHLPLESMHILNHTF